MPFAVETQLPGPVVAIGSERRLRRGTVRDRGRRLTIGLVNNMPDGALEATERQFARLLVDASGEWDVRLILFTLDSVSRDPRIRPLIAERYRPAWRLPTLAPDALIVTGAEPRTPGLREEAYWSEFERLLTWAAAAPVSNLFSCLAAHAAVLAWDEIERRRLPHKLSGVFNTEIRASHELLAGFESGFTAPHSRLNTLEANDLRAAGYEILAASDDTGPDIFIRQSKGLHVFLQGHPEYDADTLGREYRRDRLRYARGQGAEPAPPANYEEPPEGEPPPPPWRNDAVGLYRNWLAAVARRKQALEPPSFARARWGG